MNVSHQRYARPTLSRLTAASRFWLWYVAGLVGALLGLHWWFA